MAQTKKIQVKMPDAKSEFLTELVERYAYWTTKDMPEYAKAYERLIFAFTHPEKTE